MADPIDIELEVASTQVDLQLSPITASDLPLQPVDTVLLVAEPGPRGFPGPPGSGLFIQGEIPLGPKNGTNTAYTTANPMVPGTTALFRNGLRQMLNLHYSEQLPDIIFIQDAPRADDDLSIDYEVGE